MTQELIAILILAIHVAGSTLTGVFVILRLVKDERYEKDFFQDIDIMPPGYRKPALVIKLVYFVVAWPIGLWNYYTR